MTSKIRYAFGPRVSGHYARPDVFGTLADVEVHATAKGARRAAAGLIDLDFAFQVEAYDPATMNQLLEVHAIAYQANDPVPADPELALASANPKASADASTLAAGGEIPVAILGIVPGSLTIVTVLGFADLTPPDPVAADPAPTPTVEPTATPVVEPTATPATTIGPTS